MPNGNYVLCPYFIAEKTTAITCEDCVREFFEAERKQDQMVGYCCSDWKSCQYAKRLDQFYESQQDGRPKDKIRMLELFNESKANEITRIKRRLGKMRSRLKDNEREIYALKHKIVTSAEKQDRLERKVRENEIIFREKERGLYALIGTMLTRFSSADADDVFSLDEIREYAKRFETSYEIVEGQNAIRIIIVQKEAEDDDDRGSSGEVSEAGEGETRGSAEEDVQGA